MKVFSGRKGKKGFTMLEIVLVVGVLMIALAIAVPAIVRISRNLKIAKLDDIAREIYTSAQSRSISLSIGGQLSQVGGNEVRSRTRSASPETVKYKYVYKSGSGAADGTGMLLPLGSIEEGVRQNYYIIEYNPVTAMIVGVYYWENESNDFLSEGYETIDPEDRRARMTYTGGMVGYYGGDDVERPPIEEARPVDAELVNREELYLRITQGRDDFGPLRGSITVTLTDLDVGGERKISFRNEKGLDIAPNLDFKAGEYKLTMDSLLSELRFSKLYPQEGDSFHPGCNLKVTVSFREDGKAEWTKDFLTNSLFASVDGDYGSARTAYIGFGRHLENLGLLWVYQNDVDAVDMADNLNGVEDAVQTVAIDWKESLREVGTTDPTSFKPIVNPNLNLFDGKGNTISHADIFGDVKDDLLNGEKYEDGKYGIGLFSRFEGDSLRNVNLVDCAVRELEHAGDSLYVGMLAGRIDANTVFGCHAYAEAPDTDGRLNCSIDAPADTYGAGGLFGSVQNVNMERCSASLTEINGNARYAGGLAGRSEGGVTINECYADTGVWSESGWISGLSGRKVGGLLGWVESGTLTVRSSYAVGWVSPPDEEPAVPNAYGLVGGGGGAPSVQKCYAALLQGKEIVKDLVPEGLVSEEEIESCINYKGGDGDFDSLMGTGSPYVKAAKDTTHAYGMPPEMDTYPFPRLSKMPHYGDWPQESLSEMSMAYYEVYRDETDHYSIGFYSKGTNSTVDSLKDDKTVVMDGYAVMLPVCDGKYAGNDMSELLNTPDRPGLSVKYNNREVDADQLMSANRKLGGLGSGIPGQIGIDPDKGIEIGTDSYYYPLFLSNAMMAEDAASWADHNSYYQKLEVKVKEREAADVYFNPYVAKSDFVPVVAGEEKPGTPKVSILRTARQVTAYSYDAMQRTAIGSGDKPETAHTLRLERDISLIDNIKTDSTIPAAGMSCKDLSIPAKSSGASANLILELNSKTLTGTGKNSVVTAHGGTLNVFGYTAEEPNGKEGDPQGALAGGSAPECYGVRMTVGTGTLTGVTLKGTSGGEHSSVSAEGKITLDGCTIIEE